VDVHHIFDVFRVPEGKFNRLNLASLTIATNYFRPTRILCCIDWLSEVVSLFLYYCMSFDLFESNNKKCNFLELNVYFFSCSNVANVKLHLQHSKYIHII